MKKALILLTMIVSLNSYSFAQKYNFENLRGNWRNKEGAGLEIVDSSQLYVVYGNQKKQLVSYAIDFSSNPAKFNFVLKEPSGILNIKSMLLFINADVIQWQVLEPDTKPVGYSSTPKKELVILRKVEERTN